MKNHTYYFFDDMINIKCLDPNKVKVDEKSYKNILIYSNGYVKFKDLRYVKINSVYTLYLIINKINGHFEEINRKKYLALVPTDESKDKLKKHEKLWGEIRDLIR